MTTVKEMEGLPDYGGEDCCYSDCPYCVPFEVVEPLRNVVQGMPCSMEEVVARSVILNDNIRLDASCSLEAAGQCGMVELRDTAQSSQGSSLEEGSWSFSSGILSVEETKEVYNSRDMVWYVVTAKVYRVFGAVVYASRRVRRCR